MAYFLQTYGNAPMNGYSLPSYSGLEQAVAEYRISQPSFAPVQRMYAPRDSYNHQQGTYSHHETYFVQETFLSPLRPMTQFISDASEVREFVAETFSRTTGEVLPTDFTLEVLPEREFRQLNPDRGVLGFAVNRKGKGISKIVVMQNNLDMLMLVIGHEIGHVLTMPAFTSQDEEAKAFAFQFAWVKAIFEHDIAGLSASINSEIFRPAQNGVHDVAFSFVQKLTSSGRRALEVYGLISAGLIGIQNWGMIDFS